MKCKLCNEETKGRSTRCLACAKRCRANKQQEYRIKHNLIKSPGCGSGNNQRGKNNHRYKDGSYTYETLRQQIKLERGNSCNRCKVDLTNSSRHAWCIHHINHNHFDNPEDGSNWELLCKRCHLIEHKCWKNFDKVQRLSRKGVGERTVPEKPTTR